MGIVFWVLKLFKHIPRYIENNIFSNAVTRLEQNFSNALALNSKQLLIQHNRLARCY